MDASHSNLSCASGNFAFWEVNVCRKWLGDQKFVAKIGVYKVQCILCIRQVKVSLADSAMRRKRNKINSDTGSFMLKKH